MSTLKVNTIQDTSGGSSSTPAQIEQGRAKVWCNFTGTGTIAISDSYNVSSLTDSGTGKYFVNFSITMANANFAAVADGQGSLDDSDGSTNATIRRQAFTTTQAGVRGQATSNSNYYDLVNCFIVVFGDL
tara:strand:- start:1889 stop:2278 length:390 start_codon:yes stop_codon:yes gene_type:complete